MKLKSDETKDVVNEEQIDVVNDIIEVESKPVDMPVERKEEGEVYRVHSSSLNCRAEPSTSSAIMRTFNFGTKLIITETKLIKTSGTRLWGKCKYGWVILDYCRKF